MRRLNPLTNAKAMVRLNPYAAVLKRQAILANQKRQLKRDEELAKKRGIELPKKLTAAADRSRTARKAAAAKKPKKAKKPAPKK